MISFSYGETFCEILLVRSSILPLHALVSSPDSSSLSKWHRDFFFTISLSEFQVFRRHCLPCDRYLLSGIFLSDWKPDQQQHRETKPEVAKQGSPFAALRFWSHSLSRLWSQETSTAGCPSHFLPGSVSTLNASCAFASTVYVPVYYTHLTLQTKSRV